MSYNTGNPVPSKDPRDLVDNAENLDRAVNGDEATWTDRLGRERKSWRGMENDFSDFLANSGYQLIGDYAPGIEITAYNQIVRDSDGEFWRLSGQAELPYVTTGAGLPEGGAFVAVGDASLRQELASPSGAAMIGVIGPDGGARTLGDLVTPIGASLVGLSHGVVSQYLQYASFDALGAIADTDTPEAHAANVAALLAFRDMATVRELKARGGVKYYFGAIAGDTALCTFTRSVDIDWCGAEIIVDGDNSAVYTGTAFVRFLDVGNSSMKNYIFDDRNFSHAGPSRGVVPVSIANETKATKGYTFGPMFVRRGQSLLTAYSATGAYKAEGIRFEGSCGGDQCYYGVNLANNGDDFKGTFHVGEASRVFFVYGVSGFDVDFMLGMGIPSSAHLLISNSGTGFPATTNGKVRGHVGVLNGPVVMADQPVADGSGVYRDIEIEVSFDALGSNITANEPIIRVGAYNASSGYHTTEKTITADNISITANKGAEVAILANPIRVYTPSPNYGLFRLGGNIGCNLPSLYPSGKGPVLLKNGRYSVTVSGNDSPKTCFIPARYLAALHMTTPVICNLRIEASNNSGNQHTYAEYALIGQLSSTGAFTLIDATSIFSRSTGGVTPTITIETASGGTGVQVSIDSYTGNFAYLTASVSLS